MTTLPNTLFAWTTGGDKTLSHIRELGAGGSGSVHEVNSGILGEELICVQMRRNDQVLGFRGRSPNW
jgi:serine/threonine protein kinase